MVDMDEMRNPYDADGFQSDWEPMYAGVGWERKVCWLETGAENHCRDLIDESRPKQTDFGQNWPYQPFRVSTRVTIS